MDDVQADIPLIVDMDGTLLKTDTLHEAVLDVLRHRPLGVLELAGWLKLGKAGFKRRLADETIVDPETLPVSYEVLSCIEQAKAAGRSVILVSASESRQVEAVAQRFGLFDEWHGTTNDTNLGGNSKADFLIDRFGKRGFDYIGDSMVDVPVWAAARCAITIRATDRLRSAAEEAGETSEHLSETLGVWNALRPYIRALRPHQWTKNILIFAPLIAAHDFSAFWMAVVAFVAFCLTASSVYLLNDLLDLDADRAHPRKSRRPMAAGDVPIHRAFMLAGTLLLAAVLLGLIFAPLTFFGVLFCYYLLTLAYSLVLKRKLVIDVWTLAGLYTLRILAGAAATSVFLSPWILAFSMFLFFSLAAVKRKAELVDQIRRGKDDTAGRAYLSDDLPVLRGMALSAGYAAVLVFALYINNPVVEALYPAHQMMWFVPPVLLYWISRMVMKTQRGEMDDDPIIFAATDRQSQICVLLSVLAMVAAAMIPGVY